MCNNNNSGSREPAINVKLPIQAKMLDHYTLICENAEECANFHVNALGFELGSIKPINSGTVAEGQVDMLNYILHPPANKDMVMVVTEGLNDETVFQKYMKKFGAGIHHLAFEVDDVDASFSLIKSAGIKTTSQKVTTDVLSGLKQFFIQPCHAGFFIELIERPSKKNIRNGGSSCPSIADAARPSFCRSSSMAELATSISDIVHADDSLFAADGSNIDCHGEKKDDFDIRSATRDVSIGNIAAISISVEVSLPGARNDKNSVDIILQPASSRTEERQATVIFNSQGLSRSKIESLSENNLIERFQYTGDAEGIMLSANFFSYKVVLVALF